MLLSFRVSNFRSFHEEQELLLLPAYDKSRPALTVAAIYGANASGKSNLLAALGYMRHAVVESFSSWRPDGGVPREPFAFATDAGDQESTFGVDLLLDGEKYVYGFALNDARITEEWLYHHPHGRRRLLFERDRDNFHFGDTLRGPKTTIEDVTRQNSLYLSAAAQHGLAQIRPVYTWFSQVLQPSDHADGSKRRRQRTLAALQADSPKRTRLVGLLRAADFGVSDVEVDELPPRLERLLDKDIPPEILREILTINRTESTAYSQAKQLLIEGGIDSNVAASYLAYFRSISARETKISLIHETPDGRVPLPLEKESKGTQTWFDFIGLLIDVLDRGLTLLIDELDNSIHPLLARRFIQMFQGKTTNPHGAQLIFTTHDTSLLARHQGEELLGRDEVWFTEKTRTGQTRLYPLTDFKPRQGLNWERRYLGGSVGAVPFLESADFTSALDERRTADG